ncbi:MAG: hypothetical protein J7K82_05445 [Thermoproteales archaeon]|nr:hypothetical protein [Thermoproteales archaeon]
MDLSILISSKIDKKETTLDYYNMKITLFGLPEELSLMLLIEALIVLAWLIKIFLISRIRFKKAEKELFEDTIGVIKIPFMDRLILSFSSPLLAALYASAAYTFIVASFTLIIAFQPYDFFILLLAVTLYAFGFSLVTYAWKKSKEIYLKIIHSQGEVYE